MRIWDVQTKYLCRKHLLAEHRELHGLWNVLTKHNREGGYSKHPETKRWIGKLKSLYKRHEQLVIEMESRNYNHRSSLDKKMAKGERRQNAFLDTISEQKDILRKKHCDCLLGEVNKSLK